MSGAVGVIGAAMASAGDGKPSEDVLIAGLAGC
jgi:hypothetical protein